MSIHNHIFNVLVFKNPEALLKKYSKEISEQVLRSNTYRIKRVLFILLSINILLLCSDFFYFNEKLLTNASFRNVFYLHLFLLPILIIYIILYQKKLKENINGVINFLFNLTMIIWSELVCVSAQQLHGQISAYTITLFCMSSLYIFTPLQSKILFPCTFIIFVAGLGITSPPSAVIYGNIVTSFFMTTIALFISIMSYSTLSSHIISERIIADKNSEIDLLNNELMKKVESQTNELVKINSSLELEKLRLSILANISHEFKTPINVILSAEQLMEYKLRDDNTIVPISSLRKHMYSIKQNCYRLIRLVSNIIDMNTIDCGHMNLDLQNRDIVKTTEDIVLSVASYVKNKNISILFDTQVEEKVIAIDRDKMERVILNLLSNALKFTGPGGSIWVNLLVQNEKVVISVKDNGIGIPEDQLSVIFDRLVQVDRSFTKCSEGSGIGLSIVKAIIEMHNGRIYVDSSLGQGSEFVIELPAYVLDSTEAEVAATNEQEKIEKVKIEFSDIYL